MNGRRFESCCAFHYFLVVCIKKHKELMDESLTKLITTFGKYSSEELSVLRDRYPITHQYSGSLVLDEMSYVIELSSIIYLSFCENVVLCLIEDLPLLINTNLCGAAKAVYLWRLGVEK